MDTSTLTIIGGLVGVIATFATALAFVVKVQAKYIERAINALTDAVKSFKTFENEEQRTHSAMIADLRAIAVTQREILQLIRELHNIHSNGEATP